MNYLKDDYRENRSTYWLFVIMVLLLIILAMQGCRTVKLDKTSTKTSTDSTAVHTAAAQQSTHSDSAANNTTLNDHKSAFKVDFFADSVKPPSPFVIKQQADGSYYVDPGTNRIKDVSVVNDQLQQQTNTVHATHWDTASQTIHDSLHLQQLRITRAKAKSVSGSGFSGVLVAVPLLLALLAIAIYFLRKYLKNTV